MSRRHRRLEVWADYQPEPKPDDEPSLSATVIGILLVALVFGFVFALLGPVDLFAPAPLAAGGGAP